MPRKMDEDNPFSSSSRLETEGTYFTLPFRPKVMLELKMIAPRLAIREGMCAEIAFVMDACVRLEVVKEMFSTRF
jgi:hypothetical protein